MKLEVRNHKVRSSNELPGLPNIREQKVFIYLRVYRPT